MRVSKIKNAKHLIQERPVSFKSLHVEHMQQHRAANGQSYTTLQGGL